MGNWFDQSAQGNERTEAFERFFFSQNFPAAPPGRSARAHTHTHTLEEEEKKNSAPRKKPPKSLGKINLSSSAKVGTNSAKYGETTTPSVVDLRKRHTKGSVRPRRLNSSNDKKKLVEFEPGARGKPRRRCSYAGSVPVRGEGKYDTLVGTVGIFLIAFSSVYLIYFSMPTPLCPPCGVVLLHGGNDTWVSSEAPRNSIRFAAHWQFRIEIPIETHH